MMVKLNQPLCVFCWVTALVLTGLVLTVRGEDAPTEKLPAGLSVVAIEVRPAAIELTHKFDYRQLLVSGKLDSGETVDLTRLAQASSSGTAVTVTKDGLVRAKSDGSEEITFSFGGHSAKVAAKVSGVAQPHVVSFVRDVQPALSRMGCNAGTCHGA